jgi:RES domain-containing protein
MKNKSIKFKSASLWGEFVAYLQVSNRYILDEKLNEFIKVLLLSADQRCKIIKSGKIFYRARVGFRKRKTFGYLPLTKKEMLSPPLGKTKGGRINPAGISYLYLSSNVITAVSETRPWLEQLVSVAYCELRSNIKVVNMLSGLSFSDVCSCYKENATAKEKEKRIWYDIDRTFSEPVIEGESDINYIPTQYLAEILKKAGYEGIIYNSSLSKKGHNLVLFTSLPDLSVKIKRIELHRVTKIKYCTNNLNYKKIYK